MSRILFISPKPYSPWEGACHRTRHILEAQIALGYDVDLLTPTEGQTPTVADSVTTIPLPCLPFCRRTPTLPSLLRLTLDLLALLKILWLAGNTRYALIHGQGNSGVLAWAAARLLRIPCIVELRNDPAPDPAHRRGLISALYRRLEHKALRQADAVIGHDAATVARLTDLGCHSRACVIADIPAVTEVADAPARNLAKARYRTLTDQDLVTCVASYTRFQGLDLFFNALPRLLATLPHTRCVVVGGGPEEIAQMREALDRAGIHEAVTFPGRLSTSELAALLAISDVLVSSRRAGATAPIKVLDYLLSGTPIVAVDTPANRAILSPENAVITPATPEGLADGLIRLLRSPGLRTELRLKGRETLRRENRTPEAFRAALARCYTYALSRSEAE